MHEYTILKATIDEVLSGTTLGFLYEVVQPEVFGSAYAVYGSDEPILRLVWDGKDGWGFVEKRVEAGWQSDNCLFLKGSLDASTLARFHAHVLDLLPSTFVQPGDIGNTA